MDVSAFHLLEQIYKKHGCSDFGKVAQKLLAITFRRLGYTHIEERGVQGVDIDVANDTSKYTVEVKTTIFDTVIIGTKDVTGLQRHAMQDGYVAAFAILRLTLLSDWLIASAENIPPGKHRIGRFTTKCIMPLQDQVNELFSTVVKNYGQEILIARNSQAQLIAQKFLQMERKTHEGERPRNAQ